MITIDSTWVCELPVSRQAMGFPAEGDHGNSLLLLAQEMRPETCEAYKQAGHFHEGACIADCSEALFTVLDQLQLRYCPWPDRGFTLVVVEHARMSLIADTFVVMAAQEE